MDAVALNKLDDRGVADLIRYLEEDFTIRYQIYREIEQSYHEEDVKSVIDEYNENNDTKYEFTPAEIRQMAERFDDCMADYSNWHEIMMNIVREWCEDKENA
jgi:hypothetical protein